MLMLMYSIATGPHRMGQHCCAEHGSTIRSATRIRTSGSRDAVLCVPVARRWMDCVRTAGTGLEQRHRSVGDGHAFHPPKDTEEGTAVLLKPPQQRPAGDLLRASDVEPSVEHTRAHRPTQGGQRARQIPRCGRSRPRAAAVDCIAGQGAVVLRGCSDRVTPTCINRRYVTPAIAASAGPVGRGRRWRGVVSMLVGGGLGATGRFPMRGVG